MWPLNRHLEAQSIYCELIQSDSSLLDERGAQTSSNGGVPKAQFHFLLKNEALLPPQ